MSLGAHSSGFMLKQSCLQPAQPADLAASPTFLLRSDLTFIQAPPIPVCNFLTVARAFCVCKEVTQALCWGHDYGL